MAESLPIVSEASALAHELDAERNDFSQSLQKLRTLDGTELAQSGAMGERAIRWVSEGDAMALQFEKKVDEKFDPSIRKQMEALAELRHLRDEIKAPATTFRSSAKPIIGAYSLEVKRKVDAEAARIAAEQRAQQAAEQKLRDEEAERLRQEAEALAEQGHTEEAQERVAAAEAVESAPPPPIVVSAQSVAPPKVDAGRVVYWRRIVNPLLFLNWVLKLPPSSISVAPRMNQGNETVIKCFGFTITVSFDTSFKSKDESADIPGVVVARDYETRQKRR